MGAYLSSEGVAKQQDVQANYLSKSDALNTYVTKSVYGSDIPVLQSGYKTLDGKVTDLTSVFSGYKTTNDGIVKGIDGRLIDLNTQFSGYKNGNDSLVSRIGSSLDTLSGDYTGYKSSNDAFVKGINSRLSSMSDSYASYKTSNDGLVGGIRTDLTTLQGKFNTQTDSYNNFLNTTFKNHVDENALNFKQLNDKYASLQELASTIEKEIVTANNSINQKIDNDKIELQNKIDSQLAKYVSRDTYDTLNRSVQSGLTPEEVTVIKSIINSNQFKDAYTVLAQKGLVVSNKPQPAQYLRSRNYMFY
jgi:hypothetical protein